MEKVFSPNHSLNSIQRSGRKKARKPLLLWKGRWLPSILFSMVRVQHTRIWNMQRRLEERKDFPEGVNTDALKALSGYLHTKGMVMRSEGIVGR